jgi:Ran GTPase-activating protein (RanGAP) involved in mRNA processing and transport
MSYGYLLDYREINFIDSMGNQERFELLEELLQQPPEAMVWHAICDLFAIWPEEREKEEALDYADAHLSDWDDALRQVYSSLNLLDSNHKISSLGKLIRSIELYRREENGDRELTYIAKSPYFQNLKRLSIVRSEIYGGGCKALAHSPYLQNLTHLKIHHSEWLEDDFTALVNSSILKSLTFLQLSQMDLKDEDVAALAHSPYLKNLTHLNLSQNRIEARDPKAIAQAQNFHKLKYLNLNSNRIKDAGVRELSQSPYLENLETLKICDNRLSQEGKDLLKRAPQFQHTNIVFSYERTK